MGPPECLAEELGPGRMTPRPVTCRKSCLGPAGTCPGLPVLGSSGHHLSPRADVFSQGARGAEPGGQWKVFADDSEILPVSP